MLFWLFRHACLLAGFAKAFKKQSFLKNNHK
jgi:hypothetical protein